jgi:glutaminyl-tRNA synthetase
LEAIKAPKSAAILKEIIESNTVLLTGLEEKQATLIYNLSVVLSKAGAVGSSERDYTIKAIIESKLKSVDQVTGALFI